MYLVIENLKAVIGKLKVSRLSAEYNWKNSKEDKYFQEMHTCQLLISDYEKAIEILEKHKDV